MTNTQHRILLRGGEYDGEVITANPDDGPIVLHGAMATAGLTPTVVYHPYRIRSTTDVDWWEAHETHTKFTTPEMSWPISAVHPFLAREMDSDLRLLR